MLIFKKEEYSVKFELFVKETNINGKTSCDIYINGKKISVEQLESIQKKLLEEEIKKSETQTEESASVKEDVKPEQLVEEPCENSVENECSCNNDDKEKKERIDKAECEFSQPCPSCTKVIKLCISNNTEKVYCPYCARPVVLCDKCTNNDNLIKQCSVADTCESAKSRLFNKFIAAGIKEKLAKALSELKPKHVIRVNSSDLPCEQVKVLIDSGFFIHRHECSFFDLFDFSENYYIIHRGF